MKKLLILLLVVCSCSSLAGKEEVDDKKAIEDLRQAELEFYRVQNEARIKNERVIVDEVSLLHNKFHIPIVYMTVRNVSDKKIQALEVQFDCYDEMGFPVNHSYYVNNTYTGIAADANIEVGKTDILILELYGYKRTSNIKKVRFTQILYADGSHWTKGEVE